MAAVNPLPDGWEWKKLDGVTDIIGGGTPSRKNPEYFNGDIVWLTPSEIPKNRVTVVSSSKERISQEGLRKSSARLLPKGTVLMTSRASIGYVAIAGTDVSTNQGFASFICSKDLYNYYLAYWLLHMAEVFKHDAKGTTFKEISKSKLRSYSIPLPPLPEQERIVEKIEALFTQLDAGTASLRRIQAQLKRYRASVLKAAVEGRLVPQDPSDEPAEQILRRLGKSPLANKDLRNLPEGWCWTTLQNISWKADYGTSQKCDYSSSTTPVIRIPNIVHGEFDFSDLKYATKPEELKEDKALIPNDFLIIRTNGSKELIGRSCLVRNQFKQRTFFASYLIRYRLSSCSEWISTIWSSELIRSQIERIAATSAGQYNISISSLNRTLIPLPPIEEQRRIVAEVERRLSLATEVEKAVETALARAERLRQAILKQAFEGRLLSRAGAAQAQVESTLAAAHRSIPSTDEVNP